MLELTREVRFSIEPGAPAPAPSAPVINGHAGNACDGAAHYFELTASVCGQADPQSACLLNIRDIDQQVRQRAVPAIARLLASGDYTPARALLASHAALRDLWPPPRMELSRLRLQATPYLAVSLYVKELPMLRLSQRFEFSAAHRLHNPSLSEEKNLALFGKCNNPDGHGHNYELEVEVSGPLDEGGRIMKLATLEEIVHDLVIERFDHKHLNRQTAEFQSLIPSVENIARTIYRLLQPALTRGSTRLASVTVWETPKTRATCSE